MEGLLGENEKFFRQGLAPKESGWTKSGFRSRRSRKRKLAAIKFGETSDRESKKISRGKYYQTRRNLGKDTYQERDQQE